MGALADAVGLAAAIRPDAWNWPLFVHVVGAMVLVGGLLGAAIPLISRRARFLQGLGFRILVLVAVPGYVVMRVGAEWIRSKESFGGGDPAWIGVGYVTSDGGAVLLLAALIVGGVWARRARSSGGGNLSRAAGVICGVLVVAYLVAVWAMAAKPD